MAHTARIEERGSGIGASLLHGRPSAVSDAWLYVKSGGDVVAHLGRGKKGRKHKGMHGRRSGSPLPYQATRDPWGHKDMIRSTKSGAARSTGVK